MSEILTYQCASGVVTMTLDDGKANAFGIEMIAALNAGLDRALKDAKVVVITGRPGVLCGGFDLKVIRGDDEVKKDAMRNAGLEAMLKLYAHPQPVIFACTGHAVAAGALLLLTGDHRIGVKGASKIGLNEVAIGLTLPVFGLELARDRLDPRALTAATLGAEIYDTDGAVAAGYLDQAVNADALATTAQGVAERMSKLDTIAFASTKLRLRLGTIARIRDAG
jgi:enoyl-CoA hydratase